MKGLFWLLAMFGVFIVVVSILKSATSTKRSSKTFHFARKDPFLRQDEIQLLKRLTSALTETHVFPQVAMSAFVQHKGKNHAARNVFAQKYVDYLVCDRQTMRPLYVIELDGASHGGSKAQRRDKQKNEVLASAGIPIMRYTSKDVNLRTILGDYERVVSPHLTENPNSGVANKPMTRAVA